MGKGTWEYEVVFNFQPDRASQLICTAGGSTKANINIHDKPRLKPEEI